MEIGKGGIERRPLIISTSSQKPKSTDGRRNASSARGRIDDESQRCIEILAASRKAPRVLPLPFWTRCLGAAPPAS